MWFETQNLRKTQKLEMVLLKGMGIGVLCASRRGEKGKLKAGGSVNISVLSVNKTVNPADLAES